MVLVPGLYSAYFPLGLWAKKYHHAIFDIGNNLFKDGYSR